MRQPHGVYSTGLIQARNYANLTISASNAFTGILRLGSGSGPVGGGIVRLLNNYALGDGSTAKANELIRGELRLEGGLDMEVAIWDLVLVKCRQSAIKQTNLQSKPSFLESAATTNGGTIFLYTAHKNSKTGQSGVESLFWTQVWSNS